MNSLMSRFRRWWLSLPILLGVLFLAFPAVSMAQESPRLVEGQITYIAPNAVEVDGVRGLFGARSSLLSSGRVITVASVRRGMSARMELDPAGRVLELRVAGAVE